MASSFAFDFYPFLEESTGGPRSDLVSAGATSPQIGCSNSRLNNPSGLGGGVGENRKIFGEIGGSAEAHHCMGNLLLTIPTAGTILPIQLPFFLRAIGCLIGCSCPSAY